VTNQRTLVLMKPDTVQRGLVGEIVMRLEKRGLRIAAAKVLQVDEELANRHYSDHQGKPFFPGLVAFITSSPIVAMVWEGDNAIEAVRQTMGATNPLQSAPGTIRGDLALDMGHNLIHGSDSPESAEKEIAIFFQAEGVVSYTRDIDQWVTES
jgi:nucleoside-diphosphate kinase